MPKRTRRELTCNEFEILDEARRKTNIELSEDVLALVEQHRRACMFHREYFPQTRAYEIPADLSLEAMAIVQELRR